MSSSVKVGIFFTVALALLAALILRIEDWNLFGPKGKRIDALFETVVGLDDKSAVRVAGVRVGRVDGIRLDPSGRSARVTLLIETELTLTEGALATIANQGMLGDKFVELDPGPAGAPPLAPGALLPGKSAIGFDQAMAKIESDPALACPEVAYLVDFIRTASRGVILRRSGKKSDDAEE